MIRYAQIKSAAIAATITLAVVGSAVGLLTAATLLAQSAKAPATQPAAQASAVVRELDATTPKSALHALARAIRAADVETMNALVYTEDPSEEGLLEAACEYVTAMKSFNDAVSGRFARRLPRSSPHRCRHHRSTEFAKIVENEVDSAEVEIDGETARVVPENPGNTLALRREGESGRSTPGKRSPTGRPRCASSATTMLRGASAALEALSKEVAAGSFATVAELVEAMREAFGQR